MRFYFLALLFARLVLNAGDLNSTVVLTALPVQQTYQLYLDGNLRSARQKLDAQLKLDPKEGSLFRMSGILHLAETNYPAARDAFHNAFVNGDERAICVLVGLNLQLGRIPEAASLVPHLKFYVTNELFGFSERLGAATYLASYFAFSERTLLFGR